MFSGWDTDSTQDAREAAYKKDVTYVLTYVELRGLLGEENNREETPVLTLYSIWDGSPEIQAGSKEFYEGQTVTKKDLMKDVLAEDREDGDLTASIQIVKIAYGDGRMEDGKLQKGTTVEWPDGMPDEACLDTWFLQLPEEKSPVLHRITYRVTDTAGNTTDKVTDLYVKYNQFPEIKAEDRYFTLEEAKAGKITEEELLAGGIEKNLLEAIDEEEGDLTEKVRLLEFHPEEFQSFEDSGYVLVTFHVRDSMGPSGNGKECIDQSRVYVVRDGLIPEPEPIRYVRFINENYYRKNQDREPSKMTEEEKEESIQNGGLYVDSKWYTDPAYAEVIENTWKRSAQAEYLFKEEDIRQIKKFVEENGIGNSRDAEALSRFVHQYLKP